MSMRPMHAAKLKKGETYENWIKRWTWPMIATPKLDGIRTFVHPNGRDGGRTRTAKSIPNTKLGGFIYKYREVLQGFDGEMVWGDHESPDYSFQRTVSEYMSQDGAFDGFQYHVYDKILAGVPYEERISMLEQQVKTVQEVHPELTNFLVYVQPEIVHNSEEMFEYEQKILGRNYEGIMLRNPKGLYKHGRSTMLQQGLIAVKRFKDAEAEIIGMEALMRNHNEAVVNAQGLTERSSHKAFKVADDMMGKLIMRGLKNSDFPGVTFKVGTGFTDAQRRDFWDNFDKYKGQIVTYTYLEHGVKDKPRNLSFKSIRPAEDFDPEMK